MNRFSRNVLTALMILAASLIGCSRSLKRADTNAEYRTVSNDLRRNAELARQENAKAVTLIEQKNWIEAERTLKSALEADITFGPAHNNLGKVYYHQGNFYLAAWEFQYAIKSMPYQPEPRNNLGLVMEAAGKLDDAIDCYDEAGKMQLDNPAFVVNAARARLIRGDRDATVEDLLQRIALTSSCTEWRDWAQRN